jgi:integrase/recombinase XerD
MGIEAGEPKSNTFKAKAGDLSRFMTYFRHVTGSDHPDQWTRSVSTAFVKHLLKTRSERTGKRLAPSTVNRALATLRNAARWVHRQRPFLAGFPMERVSDLQVPEPTWKRLTDIEVTRLKSAAQYLLDIDTRANQNARRDLAMLLVFLGTALRVSELISLDLEQYQGKHFTNVRRRGANVTDRVFVPQEAREAIDRYLKEVRKRQAGPLFQSKNGQRLAPQNVAEALGKIAAQANARRAKSEQIKLSPHVLRHTALRKMAEKKGIRFAQQMAGHASTKYIWRYVQPSADQMEEAIDELFD